MAAVTIYLVRHGATDWSDAGRFTGRSDVPLNATGREQALALRRRAELRPPATIWSSPAGRAIETARLACGEPTIDARIHELDFGFLEGKTWSECSAEQQAALLEFESFVAPEGESVTEMRARVRSFLDGLPDGPHCVFTHGGVIRLLLRDRGLDRGVEPGEVVELPLVTEGPRKP